MKKFNMFKRLGVGAATFAALGATFAGAGMTNTFAAEIATGNYSSALSNAQNTAGLTVKVTNKSLLVDTSLQGQSLVDIETNKINAAIANQKTNNLNYENHIDTVLKRTEVEAINYTFLQKAEFSHKMGDKELAPVTTVTGNPNTKIPASQLTGDMNALFNKGYDSDYKLEANAKFDNDVDKLQKFSIEYTEHAQHITYETAKAEGAATDRSEVAYPKGVDKADLGKDISRTIRYVYEDGSEAQPAVEQRIELRREADFNFVTGEVTYTDWNKGSFEEVVTPEIKNYKAEITKVDAVADVTIDTKDEVITVVYKKIPQKAIVSFVDVVDAENPSEAKSIEDVVLDGFNEEPFNYDPAEKIKELEAKGYDLLESDYPETEEERAFDTDEETDQTFIVKFAHHTESFNRDKTAEAGGEIEGRDIKYPEGLTEADLYKKFTRVIYYKFAGENRTMNPTVQEGEIERDAIFDYVTGEVTYGEWSKFTLPELEIMKLEGYTVDIEKIEALELGDEVETKDVTVTYTPDEKKEEPKETEESKETENKKEEPKQETEVVKEKEAVETKSSGKVVVTPDTGDSSAAPIIAGIAAGGAGVALASVLLTKGKKKHEND